MNPKVLAAGLLAAGCVVVAAGGGYLAGRQNVAIQPQVTAATTDTAPPSMPVSETEAVVKPEAEAGPAATATAPDARPSVVEPVVPARRPAPAPAKDATTRVDAARRSAQPVPASRSVQGSASPPSISPVPERAAAEREPVTTTSAPDPVPEPPRAPDAPPAPPEPLFEEVVLPISSVIGLQVDTPLSSERARVEDRVVAHVTRDVSSAGRVAIPAGSRVVGAVTLVERGGKMKERARLGVRFHTLVLADGREVALRTESIFREGESPSNEAARKVGGAAIGGAILGAILGGGKGAAIGGAAGAAGGSAAVMAGDRNAATLPAGTIVTVRLVAPATVEIEKR